MSESGASEREIPLYYAAWWRRFCAFMIDGFLFLPLMILNVHFVSHSPRLYAVLLILFGLSLWFYQIYCHGRWGRTIGKYLTGTRVAAMDGSHISWRQAFLRSAVEIGLTLIAWCAIMPAYFTVPVEGLAELTVPERFELIRSYWPAWFPMIRRVQQVWMWSEFVVVLLNRRRRALHDFIAGTIVIQKKPTRRQAKDDDPSNIDLAKEMKRMNKL